MYKYNHRTALITLAWVQQQCNNGHGLQHASQISAESLRNHRLLWNSGVAIVNCKLGRIERLLWYVNTSNTVVRNRSSQYCVLVIGWWSSICMDGSIFKHQKFVERKSQLRRRNRNFAHIHIKTENNEKISFNKLHFRYLKILLVLILILFLV